MDHVAVNTRLLLPGKLEGISRFAFELLSRVVTSHPDTQFSFLFDRPFDPAYVFGENVHPYVIPPQARHPLLWYSWFHLMVPRKLNMLKPDVFFSPEFYLTSHKEIPQVSTIHDLAYEHHPEDIGKLAARYCRHYSPKYAAAAKKIITVSAFSKQDIVNTYGTKADKIEVVYNAAGKQFKPLREEEKAKVREKFSQGKPFFHFVGTIQPRKNLENLLRAFDQFKSQHENPCQLLLVGRKGWKYEGALKAFESMRNKDAVHFTGFVSDEELNQIYAASEALAYVPYFEGFGIPLVEAMQSETAIISSNVSSLPEVAGEAALMVDPRDPAAIADALQKLWQDKVFKSQLIAKGQRQVQQFNWEQSAQKLWEVLLSASRS
ncbi:MAG: glycosyltransferase family 1 protein [Bacteroidia bacterium]|nr:glycosyltransferase family 1 protein [Bacteroidia bacterium]